MNKNNNIQKLEKFDEALGIHYSRGVLKKKGVNFVFENGQNITADLFTGVKSKKIGRTLFSVNLEGHFKNFTKVKVSPSLKMGNRRYSEGYFITTDKGTNLFLPTDTKYKVQAKWEKWENGRIIHRGDHQTGVMKDPFLDGHRKALPPGERVSRNGLRYREGRKNRSDKGHNKELGYI